MIGKAIYMGLYMKKVNISFDENLLRAVDQLAAVYKLSRSAMVRKALRSWIRQQEIREFEEAWVLKLKENPDDVTDSKSWLYAEQWGDR